MKPVRTEQRNGYDIRIRTLLVHDTHNAPVAAVPVAVGHAAFVQIARDGEIYVDWHLPRNHKGSASRDEAEAQALDYAVRLVERRPFDGPISKFREGVDAARSGEVRSSEGGHDETSPFKSFRSQLTRQPSDESAGRIGQASCLLRPGFPGGIDETTR